MIASNDPATCPEGHSDTTRLLSMAGALVSSSAPSPRAPQSSSPSGSGGGCCGGGCCS
jgi:hypothetical protein